MLQCSAISKSEVARGLACTRRPWRRSRSIDGQRVPCPYPTSFWPWTPWLVSIFPSAPANSPPRSRGSAGISAAANRPSEVSTSGGKISRWIVLEHDGRFRRTISRLRIPADKVGILDRASGSSKEKSTVLLVPGSSDVFGHVVSFYLGCARGRSHAECRQYVFQFECGGDFPPVEHCNNYIRCGNIDGLFVTAGKRSFGEGSGCGQPGSRSRRGATLRTR